MLSARERIKMKPYPPIVRAGAILGLLLCTQLCSAQTQFQLHRNRSLYLPHPQKERVIIREPSPAPNPIPCEEPSSATEPQDTVNVEGETNWPRQKMSEYTATVVKRWAKAYQNAKTLQYVETLTFLPPDKKGKPTQVTLRFWGKQPNLTRVEVSIEGANEDAVMISDGTTIWEYYRPRNAYMKTPMPDVGLMVQGELGSLVYVTGPSLMFLPDPYPALVRGAVSLKAQKSSKEIAVTRVQEDKMVLTWLDAKDYLPRRFKVYQVQTEGLTEVMSGTRTRVVVDETLPKSVFTFVRPARAKQVVPENPAKALLKAGTLLPNMTAYNEEGQEVRLSALRGKPTFYVFWAHWLPLSMEFLSQLTQLKAELAEEGQEIEIVGIDVWDDPDALAQFRRTHPNSSAILLRDKNMERVHAMTTAYKRFGVRGLPTVYLVDSGGKIKKGWVGADRGNLIDMRKRIVSLSAE